MNNQRPLILDVKRHALHDGPGIRTTIFFKGCPLRCVWCHNPESMDPGLEIGFYPSDCIQCGECVEACPNGGARMDLPGRIDRVICKRCGSCAEACPGRGLRKIGRFYDIDELLDIVLRDKMYYQTSNGGVTLSGGEKQRVTIARALARDPRILILDDFTSNVDAETEREIYQAMMKLAENRTTFVIAHRLSTVKRADKIVVLDEGRIVQLGTHEELLQKGGLYRTIHDIQFGLEEDLPQ